MYRINFEEKPGELIERTFQTRKAICQGYAELFNNLCRKSGVQSYVVHGYTRQNGEVQTTGHAWIIVSVNNHWFGIDPTWGAGYVTEGRFTKSFSWDYFMILPEIFIKTHMPFDPMWQCMDYPVSIQDFYFGEIVPNERGKFFNWADSINRYEQLPLITQYRITLGRMEKRGIMNSLIKEYAEYLKQIIENDRLTKEYEYKLKVSKTFNESADYYNESAKLFNQYINYFNRQFKPVKPDDEIRKMIDTCNARLQMAKEMLLQVDPYDKTMRQNIDQLKYVMRELQNSIDTQKAFVIKYLGTSKDRRAGLFTRKIVFN
jgi:hypothetical protein